MRRKRVVVTHRKKRRGCSNRMLTRRGILPLIPLIIGGAVALGKAAAVGAAMAGGGLAIGAIANKAQGG